MDDVGIHLHNSLFLDTLVSTCASFLVSISVITATKVVVLPNSLRCWVATNPIHGKKIEPREGTNWHRLPNRARDWKYYSYIEFKYKLKFK